MDDKLKILFVGPASSGKSTLVNFLSGFRETPTSRYYATNPLRIIETEVELEANKLFGGKNKKNTERRIVFAGSDSKVKKVLIQLWDVSGSANSNQAGWPAIAHEADGIVFVFNPDDVEHGSSEKELLLWYKQFALNQNDIDANGNVMQRVQDSHCIIMAHHSNAPVSDSAATMQSSLQIPKNLSKIKLIESSLDFRSDNFKEAFDQLIEQIMIDKLSKDDAGGENN